MENLRDGKKARILVVDDHSLTRNMVKAILKGLGYENITQAENGEAAIRCLQEDKFEVVICDWNMPNMSGLDVLKKVRTMKNYKELPFLMLTAEAYRENVTAALQSGVSGYIVKPFTAEILGNKLQSVLGEKA
jgi:two-component system chemotaxis response regulator CheY